ncbi:SDR family NAD(P)-dependent oxidoreductase [Nonomuraea aurantiaca]|uniref:SDR family NAD(P)-dependent oxidoreductase n=1 Tax=Nonomuraea aurantiaca TaxID=2878562 RepID=UPI001CD9821C|nr:SDR family NAD(P)-dependent oxidoreductase [Nonomuraea aurantiaca]MCA2222627.1 SDR family NAD(P)-dependent oxidoreductase [Nonomuraea aurantiaca]
MTASTIALVTGANKGIGFEVAAQLAARGMTVLLAARDARRGEAAAARLRATATGVSTDMTAPDAATMDRPGFTTMDGPGPGEADGPGFSGTNGPGFSGTDRAGPIGMDSAGSGGTYKPAGFDIHPLVLDVTDTATIQAAAAHVADRYGRLDVLVNNAGISGHHAGEAPSTTRPELVRQVFETNVVGVLMVTNAFLPLLRRSPAARIVNVSSGVGSLTHHTNPDHYMSGLPASAVYPPSKTALNALTIQYAKELRKDGILVNAAAPGACATDFTKDLGLPITRTAADGAAIIVRLATLGPDGPTGGFFDDDGTVPW